MAGRRANPPSEWSSGLAWCRRRLRLFLSRSTRCLEQQRRRTVCTRTRQRGLNRPNPAASPVWWPVRCVISGFPPAAALSPPSALHRGSPGGCCKDRRMNRMQAVHLPQVPEGLGLCSAGSRWGRMGWGWSSARTEASRDVAREQQQPDGDNPSAALFSQRRPAAALLEAARGSEPLDRPRPDHDRTASEANH